MSTTTLTTAQPQPSQPKNAIELQPLAGINGLTQASFSAGGNDLPENAAEAQLSGAEYRAEEFNEYWKLYLSYSFSAWGDRLFEFACSIFIIDIYQTTLLPSSVYGFCTTGAAIFFSDAVGKWIDRTLRLRAIRILIPAEKITVILSSVGFWALLTVLFPGDPTMSPAMRVVGDVVFAIVVLLGCVYRLAAVGVNIAISRDWVVVIADGKSEILTRLNTTMRRIDLLCKLLAPLFVAFLTSVTTTLTAVYVVGAWNVLSLVLEYMLIYRVYMVVPTLARHKAGEAQAQAREIQAREERKGVMERIMGAFMQKWRDWLTYCNHPVFFASLSYSMLYLTVLSLGGTMIAYLKSAHYSDAIIAAIRSVGVVMGLCGTFLMPLLTRRMGLVRTGLWSIWAEAMCLAPVVASFYISGGDARNIVNVALLFGGMCLSRVGLWIFDLVQTQVTQEQVANEEAGLVNGFQFALCNLFELLQFLTVMVWSDPAMFYVPATISFAFVVGAAIVFSWYGKKVRGHLFHLYNIVGKRD